MHLSAVCALCMFLPGVDAGWTPHPDGGLEYIIQIEPELVERLSSGQGISSEMPNLPVPVRRFRFQVGDGPLPRDLGPAGTVVVPGAAAPAVALPGVKQETSAARPVQGGLVQPPIPDPHASVAAERAGAVALPERTAPSLPASPPGAPAASLPEKPVVAPPTAPMSLGPPPGAPVAAETAAAAEKARAETWAAQRAAAEKADAEKAEAARLEAERKAAEKRAVEKKSAVAAAAERAATEKAALDAAESSSLDRRGTTRMRTPIGPMEVPRSLLGGGSDLARSGIAGPTLGAADSGIGSRSFGSFPPPTLAAPSLAVSSAAPAPSTASTSRAAPSASSGADSAVTNPFALIALVGSLGLNGFLGWVVHQHRSRAALVRRWKEDRSPPPPAPSESIF